MLDFGTGFVRLAQVAGVRRGERRPLRALGFVLIAGALVLLGVEAVFNLMAFLTLKGSVRIWAACGLAGVGIFFLMYAQRCLFIETAGGDKLSLRIANDEFAGRVLHELRRAMSTRGGTSDQVIDLKAQTIEAGDPGEAAHADAPRTAVPLPHAVPHAQPHGSPPHMALPNLAIRHPDPLETPHGGPHANSMGHGAGMGASGGYRPGGPAHVNGHVAAHAAPYQASLPPAGSYNGAAPYNGQPAAPPFRAELPTRTSPPTGTRDLGTLIEFVARSQIQHKDALLDLLKVVEDHQIGGRTSRDDAVAHWQSFSEYVGQYLGTVDGLPLLTERAGRSVGR